jgi:lipoprotein-releasing system permease protein
MSRLERKIAARYLRSRRSSRLISLITLIATGGVTLGVMALIVVTGVMNGLQRELREKILVASPHVRVLTFGRGLRLEDWETVRGTVEGHPDVLAAAPFVLSQGLLSAGADYAQGVYVVGIETDTGAMAVTRLPQHFVDGDLEFATTLPDVDGGIVLGRRLAERMTAFQGDRVTMISPAGSGFNSALGTFVPQWWTFEVSGVFQSGMFEYDNAYVLMRRELAQEYAGLDAAVTGLEVRVRDPWEAPRVGAELEDALGGYPYRTLDWQSQNATLFSALQLEKMAMGLVVLLIVVVAAFNIVSTLTMLVHDKTREIGILRAMGLPLQSIRRVFVLQGVVIGVFGAVLGTVLGLALARFVDQQKIVAIDPSVYFIDHLPVQVNPLDLVMIVAASVTVAILATIYPARQAAALNPVDAIRYE